MESGIDKEYASRTDSMGSGLSANRDTHNDRHVQTGAMCIAHTGRSDGGRSRTHNYIVTHG